RYCFFFFQAEDGIRDFHVTGVQTCALPIELQRGADELRERGGDILDIVCDVTRPGEVEHMVEEVIDRWGRLDVLINNAGIIRMRSEERRVGKESRARR